MLRAETLDHAVYNIAYGELKTLGDLLAYTTEAVPGARWETAPDHEAHVLADVRRRSGRFFRALLLALVRVLRRRVGVGLCRRLRGGLLELGIAIGVTTGHTERDPAAPRHRSSSQAHASVEYRAQQCIATLVIHEPHARAHR